MKPDWLLVETLGAEPVVVAEGPHTRNLIPISTFLRRNHNLMAVQSAIGETVRGGQPLTSITPKNKRVIRTEVVQMSDGKIHGVHLWIGPPDEEPPERIVPGALVWDLTHGVATDTPESLANNGLNPETESTHDRTFAEDLPSRDLSPTEARVVSAIIKPTVGDAYCGSRDLINFRGAPIAVGYVARVLTETGENSEDIVVVRAMNWPTVHAEPPSGPDDDPSGVVNGMTEPGVYRALVDLTTWRLLKWLDEPCPYYDWHGNTEGRPVLHPGDAGQFKGLTADSAEDPPSVAVRLRAGRTSENTCVDDAGEWAWVHVTAHRVELTQGIYAALLVLRLPTDEEVAAATGRVSRD